MSRQSYRSFRVIVAAAGGAQPDLTTALDFDGGSITVPSESTSVEAARRVGLGAGDSAWVVFLDENDLPADDLLETIVRAQAAADADIVTCGLQLGGDNGATQHFFLGEPGGLGVLSNAYGTVALLRRSLLDDDPTPWSAESDPDWPLLAKLSISGAQIVSVPLALVTRDARPGALDRDPSDALLVAQALERGLPHSLESVVRLAAGLAADAESARVDGLSSLARRTARRVVRQISGGRR